MGITDDQLDEAARRFIQLELARQFDEDFAYIGTIPNIGPKRRRELRVSLRIRYKALGLVGVTRGRPDQESDAGVAGESGKLNPPPRVGEQEDTHGTDTD